MKVLLTIEALQPNCQISYSPKDANYFCSNINYSLSDTLTIINFDKISSVRKSVWNPAQKLHLQIH